MKNPFINLTHDEFLVEAKKKYNNQQCIDFEEFYKDLILISTIRKLMKKYLTFGVINERLILNYIIILGNVFGVKTVVQILYARIDPESHKTLRTFLKYLQYENEDKDIIDPIIWKKLGKL